MSTESGRDGAVGPLLWLWEWLKVAATALVLFLVLRVFVVEAFQIPTSSMEETLLAGDFLLVEKVAYGAVVPGTGRELPALRQPEVGEVVVFRPPEPAEEPPDTRYVKRVVGTPGDTLAMRSGVLVRNGGRVREPYARWGEGPASVPSRRFRWQERYVLPSARAGYRPSARDWGPLTVPSDSLFVLGDNRANSADSRHWGFVPRRSVTGTPLFIYYSYRPEARDGGWHERVRWGRLFTAVR